MWSILRVSLLVHVDYPEYLGVIDMVVVVDSLMPAHLYNILFLDILYLLIMLRVLM